MESVTATSTLRITIFRRLPLVLQTESAECGLACLSMMLSYFGHGVHLAELRRQFGFSQKGSTLRDLIEVANRLGLRTRPLRVDLADLSQLQNPCILHWDLAHFVVLKSVTRNGLVIHDPAVGIRRVRTADVSRHFTGVVLELSPGAAAPPQNASRPRFSLGSLFGTIVGLQAAMTRILLLALAIELFAILSPFFLQWTIDHALVTADRSLLLTLVIGFSMLLLLRAILSAMRSWSLMAVQASIRVQAQSNLFRHLLGLPSAFFDSRNLGDVLSRFGSQDEILSAITSDALAALMDGILVLITLSIMFIYAPALTYIAIGGALAYAVLRLVFYGPLRNASAEEILWTARKDGHLLETVRGIRAIKLFNGLEDRGINWTNYMVEAMNRRLAIDKLGNLFRSANFLLLGGVTIVVVWLGARSVLDGAFTVGMLVAFLAYKDQFLDRISSLIDRLADLRVLRVHAERVSDITLTAPEDLLTNRLSRTRVTDLSIDIRNLQFRYSEHEPYVLDGVNLRIAAGECVAIVGPSGCGKTTLLKLIASLLRPSAGDILIDGQAISAIGYEAYRSIIGVVMQDDQLFSGSIAENICFFARDPDQEKIERVSKIAAIHDDITAMPMGYNTLIGDMGTVLSGGQRQRVLLARALYRQPKMLLLDEATSHLDIGCERQVSAAISDLKITRLLVAHRPETIRTADRVIVLNQGRVAKEFRVVGDTQDIRSLAGLLGV